MKSKCPLSSRMSDWCVCLLLMLYFGLFVKSLIYTATYQVVSWHDTTITLYSQEKNIIEITVP